MKVLIKTLNEQIDPESESTINNEKDVTELFKEVLTLFIKLTNKKLNIANLKKFLAFNEDSYKQAIKN